MKNAEKEFLESINPAGSGPDFQLAPVLLPEDAFAPIAPAVAAPPSPAVPPASAPLTIGRDLDLRGLSRPLALLRLRKALGEETTGATLTLYHDATEFADDLRAFETLTGQAWRSDASGVYRVTVK